MEKSYNQPLRKDITLLMRLSGLNPNKIQNFGQCIKYLVSINVIIEPMVKRVGFAHEQNRFRAWITSSDKNVAQSRMGNTEYGALVATLKAFLEVRIRLSDG